VQRFRNLAILRVQMFQPEIPVGQPLPERTKQRLHFMIDETECAGCHVLPPDNHWPIPPVVCTLFAPAQFYRLCGKSPVDQRCEDGKINTST